MADLLPVDSLLDHVSDAVALLDRQFHVQYVNRPAASHLRTLGFNPPAAAGRLIWDLLPEIVGTDFDATLRRAIDTQTEQHCAGEIAPQRFVHLRAVPEEHYLLVVIADRTAEREVRRQLDAALERLELAINGTADGVWSWTVSTGAIWVSPRFSQMLGHTGEAHITFDQYIQWVHHEDRPRVEAALRDHFVNRRPYRAEYRIKHRDGHWRWQVSRGTSVRDQAGAVLRMVGATTDVTELREAEAGLRESQTRFRVLANHVPVGIALWSPEGRAIYANPRMLAIFEVTIDQMLSGVMSSRVHGDERAQVHADWSKAVAAMKEFEATYRLELPSGAERWVRVRTVPVRSEDRQTAGHVGVIEDITAWRESEAARRTLEAHVQHAQKLESLGVLAGGIAHDFNNLLVGILGNANLALLELPADSGVRATVQRILTAAERSADLTRQMLAYAGKGPFLVARVNLTALVREMPSLLQAVISKRATLISECDPALPDVDGDPSQLTQVVMNLLTNASDALGDEAGQVIVQTRAVALNREHLDGLYLGADLPEGTYVCLEVSDTGCGMVPDMLSRIFEPFFTTKFTGRGLGLAAVLGIVRGHGGALGVVSAVGAGTKFQIYLPTARTTTVATQPPATHDATSPRPGGLVLVVDDEGTVRAVIRRFLERWGYGVIEARDGKEALTLINQEAERLRLVLLDLTMPTKDGIETFRELRQVHLNLPVVLMSGFTEQAATEELGVFGLSGFIQKPFKGEELRHVVEQALGS